MKPVQLDHVAIGLHRIAHAVPFVEGPLGGVAFDAGPSPGFVWKQWRFGNAGVLEFLEPDGPPGGFLHRFLDSRGPGFHHTTFKVPSLADAIERARALGYDVVGIDDSHPEWKEAFLHPKQAMGIVIQLAEAPNAPVAAPQPDAAHVVALRLAARDESAARRQWVELLGARIDERAGGFDAHWEKSPIVVRVDVQAGAPDEGPLHVELSSTRDLKLPTGPHPALGATFVQVDGASG